MPEVESGDRADLSDWSGRRQGRRAGVGHHAAGARGGGDNRRRHLRPHNCWQKRSVTGSNGGCHWGNDTGRGGDGRGRGRGRATRGRIHRGKLGLDCVGYGGGRKLGTESGDIGDRGDAGQTSGSGHGPNRGGHGTGRGARARARAEEGHADAEVQQVDSAVRGPCHPRSCHGQEGGQAEAQGGSDCSTSHGVSGNRNRGHARQQLNVLHGASMNYRDNPSSAHLERRDDVESERLSPVRRRESSVGSVPLRMRWRLGRCR